MIRCDLKGCEYDSSNICCKDCEYKNKCDSVCESIKEKKCDYEWEVNY